MESTPHSGVGSGRQENSPELSQKVLGEPDDENKNMADEPALNSPWTFWFDRAPKGISAQDYFANLKKLCTVNTIKAFWRAFNNLRAVDQLGEAESYHLMRGQDRRPVWEDDSNAEGGRWTFRCKHDVNATWLELLLAAIGEGFSDHIAEGDDVVGISIKIRGPEHTVFQIWNQTVKARDQSKVMVKVKELLQNIPVVVEREKYESNKEHLVQSMTKPTYHKSPATHGSGGSTNHHRFTPAFQSPPFQPPQPASTQSSSLIHSVQSFPQQSPNNSSSSPHLPPPTIMTSSSSHGAESLHVEESCVPPLPPSSDCSHEPHPCPAQLHSHTAQPTSVMSLSTGGAQLPPFGVQTESDHVFTGTGTVCSPYVGTAGLLPTPQFRHPHEGFRYRHPPPPQAQRFPNPYSYQSPNRDPAVVNLPTNAAPF